MAQYTAVEEYLCFASQEEMERLAFFGTLSAMFGSSTFYCTKYMSTILLSPVALE